MQNNSSSRRKILAGLIIRIIGIRFRWEGYFGSYPKFEQILKFHKTCAHAIEKANAELSLIELLESIDRTRKKHELASSHNPR